MHRYLIPVSGIASIPGINTHTLYTATDTTTSIPLYGSYQQFTPARSQVSNVENVQANDSGKNKAERMLHTAKL